MTTGSWCLTEILMSVKPCSSNSEHSHRADSTSASAVARPYLASSRLSSEPALTPILIGTPAAAAARAISAILSSNALMFPGLTRTAAQPASIAANTYLGWKWMSAMTGICDLRAICGSASASSWEGTATRTIWQPVAVSSAICCSVAFTSAVSVVVIDWTDTGAPPPTGTACLPLPTMIWRDLRRDASGSWAGWGMPRSIAMTLVASLDDVNRVDDICHDQEQSETYQQGKHPDAHGYEPPEVHRAGIGLPPQPGQPGPAPFVDHDGQVPAVQREQGEQVEHAEPDVQRGDDQQQHRDPGLPADRGGDHLAGYVRGADHAGDLAARAAAAVLGEQVRDRLGQAGRHPGRPGHDLAELSARVGDGAYRPGPLEHDDRRDAQVRPLTAVDDGQAGGQDELLPVALHGDRYRLAGRLAAEGLAHLGPVVHRHPGDGDDLVSGADAGLLGGRGGIRGLAGRRQAGRHAGVDGADRGRGARAGQADPDRQREQQHKSQHEVHERAGRQHDDPLPAGLAAERARLIGRIDILQLGHADDLHKE